MVMLFRVLEFQDKIREKLSKNGFNASPAVATNDVKPEVNKDRWFCTYLR